MLLYWAETAVKSNRKYFGEKKHCNLVFSFFQAVLDQPIHGAAKANQFHFHAAESDMDRGR